MAVRYVSVDEPKISKKPALKARDGTGIIYITGTMNNPKVNYGTISEYNLHRGRELYRNCKIRWDGRDVWYSSGHYQGALNFKQVSEWIEELEKVRAAWPDLPEGYDTWYYCE